MTLTSTKLFEFPSDRTLHATTIGLLPDGISISIVENVNALMLTDNAFEKSSRLSNQHPTKSNENMSCVTHYPAKLNPTCSLAVCLAAFLVSSCCFEFCSKIPLDILSKNSFSCVPNFLVPVSAYSSLFPHLERPKTRLTV